MQVKRIVAFPFPGSRNDLSFLAYAHQVLITFTSGQLYVQFVFAGRKVQAKTILFSHEKTWQGDKSEGECSKSA